MALNLTKGLLQQVEHRKHAIVRWATESGKLEDPSFINKRDYLNNLITQFGGDPNKTEPTAEQMAASQALNPRRIVKVIK